MSREASLQETQNDVFAYNMQSVFTSMPGIVLAVRNGLNEMTVDVQPALNIKYKAGEIKERPSTMNVPVQFPASSTSALTFPIQPGDSVLLVFSMRGLDTWKSGAGQPSTPSDFRKFDKRDCFAIPGIMPASKSINNPAKRTWAHDTTDTVLVHNIGQGTETEIRLLAAGGIIINTNQDIQANCNNARVVASTNIEIVAPDIRITAENTEWVGNISHTGLLTNTGMITSNTVTVSGHTHNHGVPPDPGT